MTPEETPSPPQPSPSPPPQPQPPPAKPPFKKKGGWFQRVPREILLSPGGVILMLLAILIEIVDLIPIPVLDQIVELPLEILFLILFAIIVKPSFKSLIIPFLVERIPGLSDILPTWFIRLIG